MRRTRIPGLISSTTQLAYGLAGFLIVIVLLDSGGLAQWAERLDVGPLRAIAAPATANIDSHLRPLGIDTWRPKLILALGRWGWSDDPAALAGNNAAIGEIAPFAPPSPPPPAPPAQAALLIPRPHPPAPPATALTSPNPRPQHPQTARTAPSPPDIPPNLRMATVIINQPLPPPPPPAPPPIATSLPNLTPLLPLGPIPPGHPRQVALVGDSMMAVGQIAVQHRTTAADPKLRMVKAFRSGTGLARPDVFDWLNEYPAMIGKTHPDVIIVALGANDAQGYVDANGQVLAFGTDAWVASYRARVAAFMNLLQTTGQKILWVGLPPMKSAAYDTHIAEINRIDYTVVKSYPNAVWWNPTPYIGAPNGAFRDIGMVETPTGHRQIAHLRAEDGIHLSDDGAGLLTEVLMPWLEPLPLPPPPAPPPTPG